MKNILLDLKKNAYKISPITGFSYFYIAYKLVLFKHRGTAFKMVYRWGV